MHLRNETTYETAQLRQVLTGVYARLSKKLGPYRKWKNVQVVVRYSRSGSHYSGLAELQGIHVILRIPRKAARRRLLAYLAEHEFRHLYGGEHGDGSFPWRWPADFKPWKWVDRWGVVLTRISR